MFSCPCMGRSRQKTAIIKLQQRSVAFYSVHSTLLGLLVSLMVVVVAVWRPAYIDEGACIMALRSTRWSGFAGITTHAAALFSCTGPSTISGPPTTIGDPSTSIQNCAVQSNLILDVPAAAAVGGSGAAVKFLLSGGTVGGATVGSFVKILGFSSYAAAAASTMGPLNVTIHKATFTNAGVVVVGALPSGASCTIINNTMTATSNILSDIMRLESFETEGTILIRLGLGDVPAGAVVRVAGNILSIARSTGLQGYFAPIQFEGLTIHEQGVVSIKENAITMRSDSSLSNLYGIFNHPDTPMTVLAGGSLQIEGNAFVMEQAESQTAASCHAISLFDLTCAGTCAFTNSTVGANCGAPSNAVIHARAVSITGQLFMNHTYVKSFNSWYTITFFSFTSLLGGDSHTTLGPGATLAITKTTIDDAIVTDLSVSVIVFRMEALTTIDNTHVIAVEQATVRINKDSGANHAFASIATKAGSGPVRLRVERVRLHWLGTHPSGVCGPLVDFTFDGTAHSTTEQNVVELVDNVLSRQIPPNVATVRPLLRLPTLPPSLPLQILLCQNTFYNKRLSSHVAYRTSAVLHGYPYTTTATRLRYTCATATDSATHIATSTQSRVHSKTESSPVSSSFSMYSAPTNTVSRWTASMASTNTTVHTVVTPTHHTPTPTLLPSFQATPHGPPRPPAATVIFGSSGGLTIPVITTGTLGTIAGPLDVGGAASMQILAVFTNMPCPIQGAGDAKTTRRLLTPLDIPGTGRWAALLGNLTVALALGGMYVAALFVASRLMGSWDWAKDLLRHPQAVPLVHQLLLPGVAFEAALLVYGNESPTAAERAGGAVALVASVASVVAYPLIARRARAQHGPLPAAVIPRGPALATSGLPVLITVLLVPRNAWSARAVLRTTRSFIGPMRLLARDDVPLSEYNPVPQELLSTHNLLRVLLVCVICAVRPGRAADCTAIQSVAAVVCFGHALLVAGTRLYRLRLRNILHATQSVVLGIICSVYAAAASAGSGTAEEATATDVVGAGTIVLVVCSFLLVAAVIAAFLIERHLHIFSSPKVAHSAGIAEDGSAEQQQGGGDTPDTLYTPTEHEADAALCVSPPPAEELSTGMTAADHDQTCKPTLMLDPPMGRDVAPAEVQAVHDAVAAYSSSSEAERERGDV